MNADPNNTSPQSSSIPSQHIALTRHSPQVQDNKIVEPSSVDQLSSPILPIDPNTAKSDFTSQDKNKIHHTKFSTALKSLYSGIQNLSDQIQRFTHSFIILQQMAVELEVISSLYSKIVDARLSESYNS